MTLGIMDIRLFYEADVGDFSKVEVAMPGLAFYSNLIIFDADPGHRRIYPRLHHRLRPLAHDEKHVGKLKRLLKQRFGEMCTGLQQVLAVVRDEQ